MNCIKDYEKGDLQCSKTPVHRKFGEIVDYYKVNPTENKQKKVEKYEDERRSNIHSSDRIKKGLLVRSSSLPREGISSTLKIPQKNNKPCYDAVDSYDITAIESLQLHSLSSVERNDTHDCNEAYDTTQHWSDFLIAIMYIVFGIIAFTAGLFSIAQA